MADRTEQSQACRWASPIEAYYHPAQHSPINRYYPHGEGGVCHRCCCRRQIGTIPPPPGLCGGVGGPQRRRQNTPPARWVEVGVV